MTASDTDPWTRLRPAEVSTLLAGAPPFWWICGGWAIDLFVGRETRSHADTDVGMLRGDIGPWLAALDGWDVWSAHDGALTPLVRTAAVSPGVTSLWCRRVGGPTWDLQVMIEEHEGALWRYRRDPRVERPVSELTYGTDDGTAVLAPEIQLLYKSKDVRARDQSDFDVVAPLLSADAAAWLRAALEVVRPGDPWARHLAEQP